MKKEAPKKSTSYLYDFKCPRCGSKVSIGVVREDTYDITQWKQFILGIILGALSLCPFIVLIIVYLFFHTHYGCVIPPP